MPETIRTANERLRSRPWRGGFLAAFVIANLSSCSARRRAPRAPRRDRGRRHASRDSGTSRPGNHAAHALSLRCCACLFASWRSCAPAGLPSALETGARDEIVALQAEIDRLKALLLSEPAGPGGLGRRPPTSRKFSATPASSRPARPGTRACLRHLARARAARSAWSRRSTTLRSDGRGFVMTLTTRAGTPDRSRGPRDRRPRGAAPARRQRHRTGTDGPRRAATTSC